jgi:hypothetical protein
MDSHLPVNYPDTFRSCASPKRQVVVGTYTCLFTGGSYARSPQRWFALRSGLVHFWRLDQISRLPAIVGLVLSALMTALVIILFRDRDSVTKGMDNAGVLELAWLFASSPIDYSPLKEVETTEERTLRNAGSDIPWNGAVEEHWELHAARKRASKASAKA